MITITVKSEDFAEILEFTCPDTGATPEMLEGLQVPSFKHGKGVVLSGRGPVWLFSFIAHEAHFAKWVASYDPRLSGAVVFESHDPTVKVGTIIPCTL